MVTQDPIFGPILHIYNVGFISPNFNTSQSLTFSPCEFGILLALYQAEQTVGGTMKSKFFVFALIVVAGLLVGAKVMAEPASDDIALSGYEIDVGVSRTLPSSDTDSDGIANSVDACPDKQGIANTNPARNGCPPSMFGDYDDDGIRDLFDNDDDGDDVLDSEDDCLYTVPGTTVDSHGCPIEILSAYPLRPEVSAWPTLDNDGDGIRNGDDECGDTPADTEVDEVGCTIIADDPDLTGSLPIDTDGDTVADVDDLCVDTPASTAVNEWGCPDTDADGLFDDVDNCVAEENADQIDTDGDGIGDACDTGSASTGGGCSSTIVNTGHASNVVSILILAISIAPLAIRRKLK